MLSAVEKGTKKSALHIAAKFGFEALVEFFLNREANVDARDKLLKTPLMYACEYGKTNIANMLLKRNASFLDQDNCGRTAMHYAVYSGRSELLTLLTATDTALIHISDHAKRTPLHHAVFMESNQRLIVQKLLNMGADVNCLDSDKRTPLHHAAEANISWAVDILVKRGALTHLKDGLTKKTPIELAANDNIRELIIAYSSPEFMPNGEEIDEIQKKRYRDVLVNKKG